MIRQFGILMITALLVSSCGSVRPHRLQPAIDDRSLGQLVGTSQAHIVARLGEPTKSIERQGGNYLLYQQLGDRWGGLLLAYPIAFPPSKEFKEAERHCFLLRFNTDELMTSFESKALGRNSSWQCEDLDWLALTSPSALKAQLMDENEIGVLTFEPRPLVKLKKLDSDEPDYLNYYVHNEAEPQLNVPPGKYRVKFLPWHEQEDVGELEFTSEAGHNYLFEFLDRRSDSEQAKAWIYDLTERRVVTSYWVSR